MTQPLPQAVFGSAEAFAQAFRDGLEGILAQPTLGAFILACANASGQTELWDELARPLQAQYRWLQQQAQQGIALSGSGEDQQVFASLLELGLGQLPPTEHRRLGPWSAQFNTMRGFRPMRHANRVPESLQLPFDNEGFHFNKPFMLAEQFWQGSAHGHQLAVYYNKFPFADYHLLWVPDRELGLPQFLSREYHRLAWRLSQALTELLPGFALGYNALGAYASVNHLHFQSYMGEALPITAQRWSHNGGDEEYPLPIHRCDDDAQAWELIQALHAGNRPYNLLYTAAAIYCIPRQRQGSVACPDWSPGFAWRELCGEMVCVEREQYLALTEPFIHAALAQWGEGIAGMVLA